MAAPHTTATAAAAHSVRAGGNAIDAAIAAAFALSVVYPHNTSVGGDLIALVQAPGGATTVVNATGYASRHADPGDLARRHGAALPATGPDTVTVPGAVAGLAALHDLGAALPWSDGLRPAIELAESGVAAPANLAAAAQGNLPLVVSDPGLRAVLAPGGQPLAAGQLLRQPALAATLTELADDGPASFYRGALADRLAAGLAALGSQIDARDLADYAPLHSEPLTGTFRGHQVSTSPPNSQGFLLLETLGLLDALGADVDPLGTGAGVLSEIFQLGARDRREWLADPASMRVSAAELLAPGRLRELAGSIGVGRPAAGSAAAATRARPAGIGGDTVAIVTADTDGWAVCLIQSVFHLLGSGLLEPATGIMLHNRGSSFSLAPESANRIAPRRRPAHTLMPVLVHRGGTLRWVVGTMGGTRQPQIQAQLVLRLIGGESPAAALGAPRWVVEGGQDHPMAYVERSASRAAAASISAGLPVEWQGPDDEMTGRAQIAWARDSDDIGAVSDPRGEGLAQVVEAPRSVPSGDDKKGLAKWPETGISLDNRS